MKLFTLALVTYFLQIQPILSSELTLQCEKAIGKKVMFKDNEFKLVDDAVSGSRAFFYIIEKTKKEPEIKLRWDDSSHFDDIKKQLNLNNKINSFSELVFLVKGPNYYQAMEMTSLKTIIYDIYLDKKIVMTTFNGFDLGLNPAKTILYMRCK